MFHTCAQQYYFFVKIIWDLLGCSDPVDFCSYTKISHYSRWSWWYVVRRKSAHGSEQSSKTKWATLIKSSEVPTKWEIEHYTFWNQSTSVSMLSSRQIHLVSYHLTWFVWNAYSVLLKCGLGQCRKPPFPTDRERTPEHSKLSNRLLHSSSRTFWSFRALVERCLCMC